MLCHITDHNRSKSHLKMISSIKNKWNKFKFPICRRSCSTIYKSSVLISFNALQATIRKIISFNRIVHINHVGIFIFIELYLYNRVKYSNSYKSHPTITWNIFFQAKHILQSDGIIFFIELYPTIGRNIFFQANRTLQSDK